MNDDTKPFLPLLVSALVKPFIVKGEKYIMFIFLTS